MQDINQAKENLQKIESEWLEALEDLKSSKGENTNKDLFSSLEYLTSCDFFFKNSSFELKQLDIQSKKFSKLKHQKKDELINDIKHLKSKIQTKSENLYQEYTILSEKTLRKVQDIIAQFIENRGNYVTIKDQLNQNLDRKLFLQELKDSLEDYRQAREESITESIIEIMPSQDNIIPEDFGEETPEIDTILSQLDTAITECDYALLISESTETD